MYKKILGCLAFSIIMSLGSTGVFADEYEYPITVESDDWFSYSVSQKVEMLRIAESTLQNMSDEELVKAYPYLVCADVWGGFRIYAHNTNSLTQIDYYPIKPGTQEWKSLGSVHAKYAACKIQQDVLDKLSDEQTVSLYH